MAAELLADREKQKGKNLTFIIDTETYGLEIKYVRQIIGMQKITFVPDQPIYKKGIINLRGQIIPIMDLRLKFKKEENEYGDRTCIIVLDVNDMTVGIIVDQVSEVVTIYDDDIVDPPEFDAEIQNRLIRGIGKTNQKVIILLDSCQLVKDGEI